jgi:hypothetical protein
MNTIVVPVRLTAELLEDAADCRVEVAGCS